MQTAPGRFGHPLPGHSAAATAVLVRSVPCCPFRMLATMYWTPLTTGPDFALIGGSKETHEEMTEKAVKINEKLKAKGKALHEVSPAEFDDIAQSLGLKRHHPKSN